MKHLVLLAGLAALCSPATAQTYSYDAIGRPILVRYDSGREARFEFDLTGNLTRKLVAAGDGGSGGGGGGGCFIATAAYGSALHPHVAALREFREQWLRPHPPGRAFIAVYERVSPPIADWIRDRDGARTATRWALTPVVYAAEYPRAALVLLLSAALGVWLRRRARAAS